MMKRICALLCVLACICAFYACTKQEPNVTEPNANEALYKVKVVNGIGQPYTGKIVVKLMQDNKQIAMLAINDQGTVEKTLPKGDYSVEIMSTDNSQKFSYDTSAAKLSAEKTEIEIVLSMEVGDAYESIFGTNDTESQAFYLNPGTTHVAVNAEGRTYFLFVPTEAGNYELSVVGGNAELGVYGASVHFINENSIMEAVDGKITIPVQPSMIGSGNTGTTVYVLGVDAPAGTTDAILNIIRTGEPEWSFTEEPWSNYSPKDEIKNYTLSEGVTLKDFDLTASSDTYVLSYNSEDGYYHLNTKDGPLVFAQLGKAVYGICLTDMVGEIVYQDGVLMQTGTAPFRYSYNNGAEDFFKEDYTDAMRQYVTARDKDSGVYPLNEDLFYMLTKGVQPTGWCNSESMNYRFKDLAGINDDISWMFLLVHEDAEIPEVKPDDSTNPTNPENPTDSTEPSDPVHTHSYTKSVTAPSCTKEGYTTYSCACGESYVDHIVNATGHSFGEWITVKEATSTATGKAERKCSKCSTKEDRVLDKLADAHKHSYTSSEDPKATCTTDGVITYRCSCGDSYTETAKAKGHFFEMNGRCIRCTVMDSDVAIDDNSDEHVEMGGTLEFKAKIQAGHMMHYDVYRVGGTTLTIENSNAFVIYEGVTYHAVNGVVTVPNLTTNGPSSPVALVIGNHGTEEAEFIVRMAYPAGSMMNPYVITSAGKLTTNVEAGNEQGVFYTFTASKSGKLTITINSVSGANNAGATMVNQSNSQCVATDEGVKTVTLEVAAGDTVAITIAALPDENFKYPAATIYSTLSFN